MFNKPFKSFFIMKSTKFYYLLFSLLIVNFFLTLFYIFTPREKVTWTINIFFLCFLKCLQMQTLSISRWNSLAFNSKYKQNDNYFYTITYFNQFLFFFWKIIPLGFYLLFNFNKTLDWKCYFHILKKKLERDKLRSFITLT